MDFPRFSGSFAGCAAQQIGDISAADVITFHIQSAKLTLLMVDDFWGHHIPELRSRKFVKR